MGRVEINTRVINKHDTEANWNSHPSFIPDKSEIIVYDKDDNYNYPRVKIGDGVTTVVALPFIDDNTLTSVSNLQTEVNNVKASTSDEAINTKVNNAIQDIGALTIDLNSAESGTVPFTNSDMLGGILANQYALKSDIIAEGASSVTSINGKIGDVSLTYSDVGAAAANHTHDYVPTSRTINNKALSDNISLTYSDVGAAAANHTHDYVPTSRTINNKALSDNISLTYSDVGAAASSHSHSYAGSNSAGGTAYSANGLTQQTQITSSDALDAFSDDNYFKFAKASNLSIGWASNDGLIISIPWSDKYAAQIAIDDQSKWCAIRSKSGGTWGSWSPFYSTNNLNFSLSGTTLTITKT